MKQIFCSAFNSVILVLALFFSACTGKSDNNKAVIKALQESLENSNNSINLSSNQILQSLDEKSRDYATKERAGIWLPKAQQIQKLSEDIFNYIEGLKKINKINAETANELFEKLLKHKDNILAVDSSIKNEFTRSIILVTKSFDIVKQKGNDFFNAFFRNSSALSTLSILTELQNNIKIIETKILFYCHNMIGSVDGDDFFTSFEAIVGQSSSYVKTGEKIEITAGIGSFSTRGSPVITINRKNVTLSENGVAIYSFKASNKPGKHFVPVTLEFTDHDGKKMTQEFAVEYTVAKVCDQ